MFLKSYGLTCKYFAMAAKRLVFYASRPLVDSVLKIHNNPMRDNTISKYCIFPAISIVVRIQIVYDLRDRCPTGISRLKLYMYIYIYI